MEYLREAIRPAPQTEPHDERQVKNQAGGYSYEATPLDRLRRFLILGTEGGSYYASERNATAKQISNLHRLVKAAGPDVVALIREVSEGGLAPKNDPALLALAVASADGDVQTRRAAFDALPAVARTGTHLFTWIDYRNQLAGWGRGARRAVGNWYASKDPERLAYQMIKYRQRAGWTHRDALRLAHPDAPTKWHRMLYDFACGRATDAQVPQAIEGYIKAQEAATPAATARLVPDYSLPREALNTDHLNSAEVWAAMLATGMPVTAMIRNLANMTRVGVVAPMSQGTATVVGALGNEELLRKARVHPIQILAALTTYQQGHGFRGSNTWEPVPAVVDALNDAFYLAFGAVEPAGKRTLLALDVSGSMSLHEIAGVPGLTPRAASAAMALVTAATEPLTHICGFAGDLVPLPISPRQRLDDVVARTSALPFGRTDCALPMAYAHGEGLEIDTFIVYTDNETWAGRVHPVQALHNYRRATGIDAKLIVVGMVANDFTIADPDDAGMLDVVGFDASAPNLMAAFSRGVF